MIKLTTAKRAVILRGLVEGSSIRAVARMTGADKDTVMRLLVEVGEFCSLYQDHVLTNLPCVRVEADEIWSFMGAKQKNATKPTQGDIWTYTAICATSKLVLSWVVGPRNSENTRDFMQDVANRLANRVQLSTDGLAWYLRAVEDAFGWNGVDAQIIKTYGQPTDEANPHRRYSPAVCTGVSKLHVMGQPKEELVSTSYVERNNLSMRMGMGRFTRLTNGYSRKAENHAHAVSLHSMMYNFVTPHGTLTKAAKGIKTTPAMAAGVTDRVWSVEDILARIEPDFLLH